VDKVDTNEAEGFFPERKVLRARRLEAKAAGTVAASEARNRHAGMWVLWYSVYMTLFVNAIIGWNVHITPRSVKVIIFALWLLLAACPVLVAVIIWRNFRHANTRTADP
jgi:hypothetical protein